MNWQRKSDVKITLLPDGLGVLASEKNDWVHVVNPIGVLVWELSDGKLSIDEIIDQISDFTQTADQSTLRLEVKQFCQDLIGAGVLEHSG